MAAGTDRMEAYLGRNPFINALPLFARRSEDGFEAGVPGVANRSRNQASASSESLSAFPQAITLATIDK